MIFIVMMSAYRKYGDGEFEATIILGRVVAGTHADARLIAEEGIHKDCPGSDGWHKHTVRIQSLQEFLA